MQVKSSAKCFCVEFCSTMTCIKIPHGFQTFVLSIFEWLLKDRFCCIIRLYQTSCQYIVLLLCFLVYVILCVFFLTATNDKMKQAFRFMVGPGHCPMISKYGPSLSKAVGQVDPSFLVVKNLILIKIFILQRVYNSTKQKVHVGSQYSKICCGYSKEPSHYIIIKQPLKKTKQRS